jgi:hypothetical protein
MDRSVRVESLSAMDADSETVSDPPPAGTVALPLELVEALVTVTLNVWPPQADAMPETVTLRIG